MEESVRAGWSYTRKFSIICLILLPIFVLMTCSASYFLHLTVANRIVSSQRQNLFINDHRSVIEALRVLSDTFSKMYFSTGRENIAFVIDRPSAGYFPIEISIPVFVNENSRESLGSLGFLFQLDNSVFLGFLTWIASLILLAPVFLFQKRKIILEFENQSRLSKIEGYYEVARQVAHDIRSPLTALECLVSNVPDLSSEKRELLILANSRIRKISDDLLTRSNNKIIELNEPHRFEIVSSVKKIIAEKRVSYPSISFVEDNLMGPRQVRGGASEFERLLSNIIQNCIDSLEERPSARVEIALRSYGNKAALVVSDNGKGIEESVLKRVGQREFSYGKANGNGLGVSYAMENIRAWGGEIQISSKLDVGTSVSMTFNCL